MKKLFLLPAILAVVSSKAGIILPSVISSHMVLQQKSAVKLWGWASPAEKIYLTTSWNNVTDSTVTTRDAHWQTTVQTPEAGGPYTITVKGANTIILNDILIGEVWVCSGQSNMEYNYYNGLEDVKAELPRAANPGIRFFHIPKSTAAYPQDNCPAQWVVCDSNSLKTFSAVGYFFGKKLHQELNVPIGLINASWGGTPAEVWTPADSVHTNELLKQAVAKQTPSPWWTMTPGYAYNAMIAPITNYKISGAIWYQGEGNTAAPDTYSQLFKAMIRGWRKQWGEEFPFYYVQIAPFTYGANYAGALIREQQAKTLELPKVGMVIVSDLVDDTTDIHPRNKHDVGYGLANLALANTYQKPGLAFQSPLFKSMRLDKNKAVISFDHAPNGLIAKDKNISPLLIAGSDQKFYPAEAQIRGGELIVWNRQVKQPVAVRYSFSNAGVGNLFSKEGLPVAPFRTDEWAVDSSPK